MKHIEQAFNFTLCPGGGADLLKVWEPVTLYKYKSDLFKMFEFYGFGRHILTPTFGSQAQNQLQEAWRKQMSSLFLHLSGKLIDILY